VKIISKAARILKRGLALITALVLLGYISSLLSVPACEKTIGDRVAAEIGVRTVFVLPKAAPDAETRLRRTGFVTQECRDVCFPWAEVSGAASKWPFVATVESEYVAAPTSGAGRRTTFLCFFGFVIELSEKGRWVA
jgi:hypothetical protein